MAPSSKSKKGEGFHSAAGLIRYYDAEEDSALKIDPKYVMAMCIITVVVVEVAKVLWPVL